MTLLVLPYNAKYEQQVVDLWNCCGLIVPWNDPYRDIQRKMKINPEMFLVGLIDDVLVATVMAGYEGHRGWINYLAVHPNQRGTGIGKKMMIEAENLLLGVECPKICLQVRSNNTDVIQFYKKIGYFQDEVVSLGKRLVRDNPYRSEMRDQE